MALEMHPCALSQHCFYFSRMAQIARPTKGMTVKANIHDFLKLFLLVCFTDAFTLKEEKWKFMSPIQDT